MLDRLGKICALVLVFALVFCMPMSPVAWGETGEALDAPQTAESPANNEVKDQTALPAEETPAKDEETTPADDSSITPKAKGRKGASIKSNTGKDASIDIDVTVEALIVNINANGRIVPECTVRLYADGKEVDSQTLDLPYSKQNNYISRSFAHHVFEDQPKFNSKGQTINYSITIDPVDEIAIHTHQGEKKDDVYYYTASLAPEKTDVTVDFYYYDWMEGYSAAEGDVLPQDFEVTLLQNGKPYATKTVEHFEDSAKLVVFNDVPIYDENGATYKYEIDEADVRSQVGKISNKTNYLYPYDLVYRVDGREKQAPEDKVKITIYPDAYSSVPEKFSYVIYANGEPVVEETQTMSGGIYSTFFNHVLPKEEDGQEIQYSVTAKSEVASHKLIRIEQESPYVFRPYFEGNTDNFPVEINFNFPGMDENDLPNSISYRLVNYSSTIANLESKKSEGYRAVTNQPGYSTGGYEIDYSLKDLPAISGHAPVVAPIVWDEDGGHINVTYVPAVNFDIRVVAEDKLTDEEKELVSTKGRFNIEVRERIDDEYGSYNTADSFAIDGQGTRTVDYLPATDSKGNKIDYYVTASVSTYYNWTLYNQGYTCSVTGDVENGFTVLVGKKSNTDGDGYQAPRVQGEIYWEEWDYESPRPEITLRLYKNGAPTEQTITLPDDMFDSYSSYWGYSFELEKGEDFRDYDVQIDSTPDGYYVIKGSTYDSSYSNYRNIYFSVYEHEYEYADFPFDITLLNSEKYPQLWHEGVYLIVNGQWTHTYLNEANQNDLIITDVKVSQDGEPLPLDKPTSSMLNANQRFISYAEYDPDYDGQGNPGYHVYVDYIDLDKVVIDISKAWDAYNGNIELMIGHKWMSMEDAHGVFTDEKPDPITVHVLRDGEPYTTLELGPDNNWLDRLILDRYDMTDGHEYVYTYAEQDLDGYYSTVRVIGDRRTGNYAGTYDVLLFNSLVPGTYIASKNWDDKDNKDGSRPSSILVTLFANGIPTLKTVLLNEENGWTATFDDLPIFDGDDGWGFAGSRIIYTIYENIMENYFNSTESDGEKKGDITNKYIGTTYVAGKKTWEDNNNDAGKRPDSITVNLLANGEKVDSKIVTAKEDWKYRFEGLPTTVYGEAVEYTISEEPVKGYDTKIEGYNITNTYKENTLSVKKTSSVKNARIGDTVPFTITIYNKGEATDAKVKAVDIMPEELDYVSSDTDPVSASDDEVVWEVNVPAGGKTEIKLYAKINNKAVGKIVNTVIIYDEDEMEVPEDEGGSDDETITLEKKNVNDAPPAKKVSAKKLPLSPATGDEAPIGLIIAALLVSGALMSLTRKKADK